MRNTKGLKKLLIGSIFGVVAVAASAVSVDAQSTRAELREWQKAQKQVQKERRDYARTRSARDYRELQLAQQRAAEERAEYERSRVDPNYRNNDRVRGSGYYNNGNNGGYNNTNRRYRVLRNGSYYQTDYRGAELLKAAVNNGYSQGYQQGQQDRQYRRQSSYYGNQYYRSGDYGYQSHVARDQYQYYFQQGFQRGYQDGYNTQTQYGYRSGNNFNILGNVLSGILNFVID